MTKYIYIFKETLLTIYLLMFWSQNVLIENFKREMKSSERIINSFQTFWNKLAKLSIRKLTLTSQTLYIQFHDVGTYELLPISQKSLKISNWNFTCILQRYIGIRKYQYLNFDQVPHLDPKSHGWSHIEIIYNLQIRYGSLLVSLLANKFNVHSVLHGQVSLAAVDHSYVFYEVMSCKKKCYDSLRLWKCKYKDYGTVNCLIVYLVH